jgi:hypothetical protein
LGWVQTRPYIATGQSGRMIEATRADTWVRPYEGRGLCDIAMMGAYA